MDMKKVQAAVGAYQADAGDAEKARLSFFQGLWEIQDELAQYAAPYTPLDDEQSFELYKRAVPIFTMAPPRIDVDAYRSGLHRITAYLVEHAGLEAESATALGSIDWDGVIPAAHIGDAPRDVTAFLDTTQETLSRTVSATLNPGLIASALISPLTPLIEEPARCAHEAILAAHDNPAAYDKSLRCPVCGGKAVLAYVGETAATQGRGRTLLCQCCHTEWDFERIRCARCGSTDQHELHYVHIEGDEAHRIHVCDSCQGYIRTLFQDETDKPISLVVEDVVMTKLDMIAARMPKAGGKTGDV